LPDESRLDLHARDSDIDDPKWILQAEFGIQATRLLNLRIYSVISLKIGLQKGV
jgi:hypothetical protein